jgi:DNA-binding FrmR family transcriptional regulator
MENMETTTSYFARKKIRDDKERHDLMNRLKRIEGQVRGLQRMLEQDAYCPDILTQASAVSSAISSFCRVLLTQHLRTCVVEDIRAGHDEAVDELADTLQKLMK